MKMACCVWCLRIVKMPDTFDPKDPQEDVVCSKVCCDNEAMFRFMFSDSAYRRRMKNENPKGDT